ncbi:MAG: YbbR-like domain-containing protein [Planctomycetota bacterium]|jgi:hypothetical protein
MAAKINFSKIAIVIFLTVLIWVWADLAVDETHTVPNVSISIARSTDPELWATFKNEGGMPATSFSIDIRLKGPASRIAEIKRELGDGSLKLAFSLHPDLLGMTAVGSHTLPVLDVIRSSEEIRELNTLTVDSCEPKTLTVDVARLGEKPLNVECVDENGMLQESAIIDPKKVNMLVPKDWSADLPARVELTRSEIERARSGAIGKTPYVVLADGQKRLSDDNVEIRIPPEEDPRSVRTVKATVGYIFSDNTQGKYKVEIENKTQFMSETASITVRATPEAAKAYEDMGFQAYLEIYDVDADATDWVKKLLTYDFPDEHAGSDGIKLAQEPVEVRFKLTRLTSDGNP